MEELSQNDYWQLGYQRRMHRLELPNLNDFRNVATKRMVQTLEAVELEGKRVLEVGAGDSDVVLLLAQRFVGLARFAGMDYSDAGCHLLQNRGSHLGVEIEITNSDLFRPPKESVGGFDLVYSLGLVEHFDRLDDVLAALTRFLRPGGPARYDHTEHAWSTRRADEAME